MEVKWLQMQHDVEYQGTVGPGQMLKTLVYTFPLIG